MSAMNKNSEDVITIELDGESYLGRRSITGSRSLYQSVSYGSSVKKDGHSYSPAEKPLMDSVARMLLIELVHEANR
jgi:hypothetical protein